ncbi:phosphogluconate dehydratase [Caulobacter sp. 17J80-11]|uniref:phosphogluconate dehydratase n=1 Tax=Caulobacter sp. 17J80-11 TaxID=2763502 RepID=UPI001653D429|nr:phosphogluconate dehydratase [Caulobacter sp. 17J80-11]
MPLHPVLAEVTARIEARSRGRRAEYEARMQAARRDTPARTRLACSNLAHVFAASGEDKPELKAPVWPNLGVVTAYNDMLSAHQPYEHYPEIIRHAARSAGAVAQVAGGVPAMCDGVTQGYEGMELSLFSRDAIALGTGVALSHDAFDGVLLLGICDKIVPGLFMGAAPFGHLPIVFVPGGPMPSGIPNAEKAKVRQRYAEGLATRTELLEVESASYHSAGTCTFYGTANTNQMCMEAMGLHVPGAAFVNPNTPLRKALTEAATVRAAKTTALGADHRPFWEVATAKALVNAVVGLCATGGSTNHTLHLVAMARAVGVELHWEDFADLSAVVPLLARVYPNGSADVNHFHAAGGMGFVMRELLDAGLMHDDVKTIWGEGLRNHAKEPALRDGQLVFLEPPATSLDLDVLRPVSDPFSPEGGLRLLAGNLGRGVVKVSAVKPDHWTIEAPARVFTSQAALEAAFKAGELDRDFVAVLPFQGPRAIGMPELHKLTPVLGALQDRGHRVALVTDGRMSGASGKVLSAIHVTPEAEDGGPIGRVRDGDVVRVDAEAGLIEVKVPDAELMARPVVEADLSPHQHGVGRELFALFRRNVGTADTGASVLL